MDLKIIFPGKIFPFFRCPSEIYIILTTIKAPKITHQRLMKALSIMSMTEILYMPFWKLKLMSRIPRKTSAPPPATRSVVPCVPPVMFNTLPAINTTARMMSGTGKECS